MRVLCRGRRGYIELISQTALEDIPEGQDEPPSDTNMRRAAQYMLTTLFSSKGGTATRITAEVVRCMSEPICRRSKIVARITLDQGNYSVAECVQWFRKQPLND